MLSQTDVHTCSILFDRGPSSSPVWVQDLSCSLFTNDCTHSGFGNTDCTHDTDVAISCLAGTCVSVSRFLQVLCVLGIE